MIQKVPNYITSDQASNLQSGAQNKALDDLGANPLNSGAILKSIALTAGSNSVSHKLGRKLQGYIVVSQDAASSFFKESSDTNVLKLNSSAAVNAILFVF